MTENPYISHFPGKSSTIYKDYIEEHKADVFTKPDNLSILSVITKEYVDTSCLNNQCKVSNIELINPLKDRFVRWNRYDKPKYILDGLYNVIDEYTLILDGNDVLVNINLDNIIEDFKQFKCDILYNSTCYNYPKVTLDSLHKKHMGKYKYLNAGVCIGTTKKLIEFYELVKEEIDNDFHHYDSEQYYIKKMFGKILDDKLDRYDFNILYDYQNTMFQCMHKR